MTNHTNTTPFDRVLADTDFEVVDRNLEEVLTTIRRDLLDFDSLSPEGKNIYMRRLAGLITRSYGPPIDHYI